MCPTLTGNNASNVPTANTELSSKLKTGNRTLCIQFPNLNNLVSSQLRSTNLISVTYRFRMHVRPIPSTCGRTSLAGHIFGIISRRAEEQMIRADALLYVTSMANKKPLWYRTIAQLIRKAVGGTTARIIPEPAIAISDPCIPQPTSICLSDLSPKSLFNRYFDILTGHFTNLHNRLVGVAPEGVSRTALASSCLHYSTFGGVPSKTSW